MLKYPVTGYKMINDHGRDELAGYLKKRGIATGIYYPLPLHRQSAFADRGAMPSCFRVPGGKNPPCLLA